MALRRSLEDRVYRWRMARRRRRAFAELRASGDPTVAAIGRALEATQAQRLAPEERAWVERIEGLRQALGDSDEVLRTSHIEWTGEEADRDVFRTKPVSLLATSVSKPRRWGVLMLKLVRELQPEGCLELGSCIGISAAYQAAALELNGGSGRLVTLEADSNRARVAEANFAELGLEGRVELRLGRFQETLEPALAERRIDFAFIDGHHQEQPTLEYFERIAAQAPRPAVLLFDDVGERLEGMRRAWRTICADPRVSLAVEVRSLGICVLADGAAAEPTEPVLCPLFA
jgi:predicted O-methyltransferase YrrM